MDSKSHAGADRQTATRTPTAAELDKRKSSDLAGRPSADLTGASNARKLTHQEREAQNLGWRSEVQEIPKQRSFALVFFALCLCVFLGALDQTIIAVALPTIVQDIGGASAYGWYGSAYLLMAACLAPLYGKMADVAGRKYTLITAVLIFILGSGLCGGAQTPIWLIMARGVQGMGGGGIIQLVQITISDITTLQDRGKYTGMIGSIWGVASILGPLVGGGIVDNTTWRWIFYINLPTAGVAAVILLFCLNVPRKQGKTVKQHAREFDFIGLTLIVGGVASLLVGLNNGEKSWGRVDTYVPLAIGVVAIVLGAINEIFTKQSPVVPPRLFRTRTTAAILGLAFFHGIVFFSGAYFLPVYYQALGSNALLAGVRTLPFSLGASVTSIVGGVLMGKIYRNYKVILMVSFGIMTLGFGLMIMLDSRSSIAEQVILPLIAAAGIGPGFPVPLIALQSAMPPSSIATGTATFGLTRTLAGAIGIAIGSSIYGSELRTRLSGVQGFDVGSAAGSASEALSYPLDQLKNLQPEALRTEVVYQYSKAIQTIWIVATPLAGVAFLLTFLLKVYSLNRPNDKTPVGEKGGEKAGVATGDASSDQTVADPPAGNKAREGSDVEEGIPSKEQTLGNGAVETGIDGRARKGPMGGGEALGESVPL